jgi:hypothetical protein
MDPLTWLRSAVPQPSPCPALKASYDVCVLNVRQSVLAFHSVFISLYLCLKWHPYSLQCTTFDQSPMGPYSLCHVLLLTRAPWALIPYVVFYYWPEPHGPLFPMSCSTIDQSPMGPYSLCHVLLLTRALWAGSKADHYIWNGQPFRSRHISSKSRARLMTWPPPWILTGMLGDRGNAFRLGEHVSWVCHGTEVVIQLSFVE